MWVNLGLPKLSFLKNIISKYLAALHMYQRDSWIVAGCCSCPMAGEQPLVSIDCKIYSPISFLSGAFKSLHGSRETQKLHVIAVVLAIVLMTQTGFPPARSEWIRSHFKGSSDLEQGSPVKLRNENKQILTSEHKWFRWSSLQLPTKDPIHWTNSFYSAILDETKWKAFHESFTDFNIISNGWRVDTGNVQTVMKCSSRFWEYI